MKKQIHSYEYPRPALTVDIVVFGVTDVGLSLLLIRRGEGPFKGRWALPGGFVGMNENLLQAASRELLEETGLKAAHLEQLSAFGDVKRDPRGRVVTVAFFAVIKAEDVVLQAGTDAVEAKWMPAFKTNNLAFDHDDIVDFAVERVRSRMYTEDFILKLLPQTFTLTDVQKLYESFLNQKLDKRNFRKQLLASGRLRKTRKKMTNVAYRSPTMYTRRDALKREA